MVLREKTLPDNIGQIAKCTTTCAPAPTLPNKSKESGWQQIWEKKGMQNISDARSLNGHDNTKLCGKKSAQIILEETLYDVGDSVLEVGCGAGYLLKFLPAPRAGVDRSHSLV